MYQNLPNNQMNINPYYNPYYPQYQQRVMPTPIDNSQNQSAAAPTAQNYLKGWPVTSIEQARAARIDLDGSPFLFTDYGHNKIYMKQINMDGTAALRTFTLVEDTGMSQQPDYVTQQQLQEAIKQLRASLSTQNITQMHGQAHTPSQPSIVNKF